MKRTQSLFATVVVAALAHVAAGHICVLNPVQRGGVANISTPGNDACWRPEPPCGTITPGPPITVMRGGEGFEVVFQQNLNHYNPGWPGFLDVAYAPFPEPTSDDNFTTLYVLPDYWAHLQAAQTNFSVAVLVPNIDCPHCVLRVRYHPNKPTEPIFHNCADVTIVSTAVPKPDTIGRTFGTTGEGSQPSLMRSTVTEIKPSGELGGCEASDPNIYFPEGVVTAMSMTNTLYYLTTSPAGFGVDSPAWGLTALDVSACTLSAAMPITATTLPQQLTAIVAAGEQLIALGITANGTTGFFNYEVRTLQTDGSLSEAIGVSVNQDTFVNLFWADYCAATDTLYFAGGDENSLYSLRLQIFTVDMKTGVFTTAMQDISQYTLSNFHVDPSDCTLYSVTPGLYHSAHAYSLVTLDPATGAVATVGQVAPGGLFDWSYGGGVYGDAFLPNGNLLHMFRDATWGAYQIAEINVTTGAIVRAPTILTGTNFENPILSPVHINNNS